MQRMARDEGYAVLHPEYGTRPRVYYKNLHRIHSAFISGTVAGRAGDVEECIAGARIALRKGGSIVAETTTDTFGDFRFDGIEKDSGDYEIEVQAGSFSPAKRPLNVAASAYVGVINLENA